MLRSLKTSKSSRSQINICRWLSRGRWLLVALAFVAGWHLLTNFRTMHYGESAASFTFYFMGGSLIIMPAMFLFAGTGAGKPERYSLTLAIAAIVASSLWANTEEKLVTNLMPHICETQPCVQDDEGYFVYTRLAPFSHHEFRYHPEEGWQD